MEKNSDYFKCGEKLRDMRELTYLILYLKWKVRTVQGSIRNAVPRDSRVRADSSYF